MDEQRDEELIEIIRNIEILRKKMNELAKYKTITDPAIIAISQKLDLWLNKYNEISKVDIKKNRMAILFCS